MPLQNIQNVINLAVLGDETVLVKIFETWLYFSTAGTNPQTRQDMQTAGTYERTREDLES